MLKHVVDYSASSGIAEEGVLVVYYEAVKVRGSVLVFGAQHRIQVPGKSCICLLL